MQYKVCKKRYLLLKHIKEDVLQFKKCLKLEYKNVRKVFLISILHAVGMRLVSDRLSMLKTQKNITFKFVIALPLIEIGQYL